MWNTGLVSLRAGKSRSPTGHLTCSVFGSTRANCGGLQVGRSDPESSIQPAMLFGHEAERRGRHFRLAAGGFSDK
jgi:hypothetical protein